ncbi:hypothetical protein BpHYR1_008524 [Brachionus plicatilis]|uniref:Uncharacterized protein n=1 Tax=Brachionus plicatilis TaxID=10195 RepID=A0A3M7T4U7_BRAPC|nr:hypothetical protein BpHYR1_008524 [Brachionus plicatilis]
MENNIIQTMRQNVVVYNNNKIASDEYFKIIFHNLTVHSNLIDYLQSISQKANVRAKGIYEFLRNELSLANIISFFHQF